MKTTEELRIEFAARAMQGLATIDHRSPYEVVKESIRIADEMVKQLEIPQPQSIITLGEFLTKFSHNNIIRLVYPYEGGHKIVAESWEDVAMDHSVTNAKGIFRHYINNKVLGLVGIYVAKNYPEALNIIIEELEDQPFVKETPDEQNSVYKTTS